jgi:hypothetical protein
MLWRVDQHPTLICMDEPRLALPLARQPDLATLWTSRTLVPPELDAALATARHTPVPTVVLTHHHLAREHPLRPGPALRLVTTHVTGDEPLQPPGNTAFHRHLPPDPDPTELGDAVGMLLRPVSAAELDPASAPPAPPTWPDR